ncbi:hypothetical protein ACFVT2_03425 [Streptomyces sp. NPDC058000]|uniref:hypothetical protein n=1 Tax=Streptomyces sp. NPDC058000 TaxID=3346299 RepID=UPI0036E4FBCE
MTKTLTESLCNEALPRRHTATRPAPSPLPPTARLSPEQREFAATRRDVARQERGTRERPDALTAGTAGTAKLAALEGRPMMGGYSYGYGTEYGMERRLRTAVVSTVSGGTSEMQRDPARCGEIQRDIVGKRLGL